MDFLTQQQNPFSPVGNNTNLLSLLTGDTIAVPLQFYFLLPMTDYISRIILYGVISGFGVVANIISILGLTKGKLYRTWTYAVVLNISITDLILCLTVVIFFLPNLIYGRYYFPVWSCRLRYAVVLVAGTCSVLSYVLLAIQRFLVVVFNMGSLKIFKINYLPYILASFWITAIPLYTQFWTDENLLLLFWPDNCMPYSDSLVTTVRVISGIFIFFPLSFILVLYVTIYIVVRRSSARVQTSNSKGNSRKDIRMALVLFFLYIMFAVAYVPFVMNFFVNDILDDNQLKDFMHVSMYTGVGVSVLNPLFYAILFKPLQEVYLGILGRGKSTKKINVSQRTESTSAS